MFATSLRQWSRGLSSGALDGHLELYYGAAEVPVWRQRYQDALELFGQRYGEAGDIVVARCPGQMNIMGVHIDYGGMPSIRLAVRGRDTLTVARGTADGSVRLSNVLRYPGEPAERFAPVAFDLAQIVPAENVGTREAIMSYAGRLCAERQARTGRAQVDDWGVLVQGQLVFLESLLRGRAACRGFDGLVWSNVSPSGGMSSSSALVIATACAALGVVGLDPRTDVSLADLVDGVGTSEWIRGTRGGTADHGGMVMGRAGKVVSVGVFPAASQGEARLPGDYVAFVLDSGVPRVYDDAMKEETVIAYPLGTFLLRDIVLPQLRPDPEFAGLPIDLGDRIRFIRDLTEANLGLGLPALYRLLAAVPRCTTLAKLRQQARQAGAGAAFDAMHAREVAGKFPHITDDYPIWLRRRFVFGLAEQDRVRFLLEYLNAGQVDRALELMRVSHDGDLDQEVPDEVLAEAERRARRGDERARLCFLPGGYGRMTVAYDRVVRVINEFLLTDGGPTAGSVQRFGAGWGGNIGGLVRREYATGDRRADLARVLADDLGLRVDPAACIAVPGEGACLVPPPA
jgi:galactokinase